MAGKKPERLELVHPDCAGIDVGKRKHYVAVDPSRFEEPVRRFGTFTGDLEAIADGCPSAEFGKWRWSPRACTGSPCSRCSGGFRGALGEPARDQTGERRKSDVLDCQWIRQLMSYGLLRGAFRAPDALCPTRS